MLVAWISPDCGRLLSIPNFCMKDWEIHLGADGGH
jgi:hypothetical protein